MSDMEKELRRLKLKTASQDTLIKSLETELAILRKKVENLSEAERNLESEREANAILTAELDEMKKHPTPLQFPTMLRKMWSGTEVQGWLDAQLEGKAIVPIVPSKSLLLSMAIRSDHGLAIPGYYDQEFLGGKEGTHEMRLQSALRSMRQLHEEVVGTGFHGPNWAPPGVAIAGLGPGSTPLPE